MASSTRSGPSPGPCTPAPLAAHTPRSEQKKLAWPQGSTTCDQAPLQATRAGQSHLRCQTSLSPFPYPSFFIRSYFYRGAAKATSLDIGKPTFDALVDKPVNVLESFAVLTIRIGDFPLPPPFAKKKGLPANLRNLTRDPGLMRMLHDKDQIRSCEDGGG